MAAQKLPWRLAACAFSALFALACGGLDDVTSLHDLRILAVKTEPAEIKLPAVYALVDPASRPPGFPLPQWDVAVTVYAYDPRGGEVTTSIFMCPESTADPACFTFDPAATIAAAADDTARAQLETVYQPHRYQETLADPAQNPAGPIANNRHAFDMSTAVIDSLLWKGDQAANLVLSPLLPRFVVQVDNSKVSGINHERAYKRLPMSLDYRDPMLPPQLLTTMLRSASTTVCHQQPDPFVEGAADCFYDFGANTNPVLVGFDLFDPDAEQAARDRGEEIPPIRFADDPQLGTHPVLLVEKGATLHIRPVFKPSSMEPYQVFVAQTDLQGGGFGVSFGSGGGGGGGPDGEGNNAATSSVKLSLENRYEDFVCDWYATAGNVPRQTTSTSPGEGGPRGGGGGFGMEGRSSLDADWELPGAAASGNGGPFGFGNNDANTSTNSSGRDALILVVQDQRGGVAVGEITVEYQQ